MKSGRTEHVPVQGTTAGNVRGISGLEYLKESSVSGVKEGEIAETRSWKNL